MVVVLNLAAEIRPVTVFTQLSRWYFSLSAASHVFIKTTWFTLFTLLSIADIFLEDQSHQQRHIKL